MLGISIYPEKENINETINYIKLANKYGFKRIFTCLLSVNDTKEKIKEDFSKIIKQARDLNMEVILDIAPRVFNDLGISYDDLGYFAELGATGIRLDEGFDGLKEATMTFNKYDLDIEINMSNGTKYVDNIISFNPNRKKLIGCHNFYPMAYSGLSVEHFLKTSKHFKDFGLRTAAFVSSNAASHGPWPVMDNGLCTLEIHRGLPIETQIKHLLMMQAVDDIIIANAYASEEELKSISQIKVPEFKIEWVGNPTPLEKKIVLDEPHFNRGDISDYLIRSTQSRVKYKDENFISHDNPVEISKGDVIVGNDFFGQYKGELQLIKLNHHDLLKRKNVVARVVDQELFLIDWLKPWSVFKFVENKKD